MRYSYVVDIAAMVLVTVSEGDTVVSRTELPPESRASGVAIVGRPSQTYKTRS